MSDTDLQSAAPEASAESVEARAKSMGWTPLERFRGDPQRWVDAETFVARGEQMLPLLRAHNHKLEQKVSELEAQSKQMAALFAGAQETMVEITEQARKDQAEALDRQRAELTAELATAREEGNVAREVEVQDQLQELRERKAEAKARPEPRRQQAPAVDAEFAAWRAENPWYGTDAERTMDADYVGRKLALNQPLLKGRAFYDRVVQIMDEQATDTRAKVGPGRATNTGGGGGGGEAARTYNDLSADARAVCDRQAARFVGDGKMFKTVAEWRTYYCKQLGEE